MGLKYTLFLLFCIAVTVLFTIQTKTLLLEEKNSDRYLTRVQGETILKELEEIRTTLKRIENQPRINRGPTIPRTASASTKGRPALGNPNAGVTIVEFTDYQCPFCRRFQNSTFKQLKQNYIDTGKVRWVVLDMPLAIHKDALLASHAAHCAGEQEKFWELRTLLFQNQTQLLPEHIVSYAKQVGIQAEDFNVCMSSNRYQETIQRDIVEAEKQRITGTPTFVIGRSSADVISGKRIVGALPYRVFSTEIESLLKTK